MPRWATQPSWKNTGPVRPSGSFSRDALGSRKSQAMPGIAEQEKGVKLLPLFPVSQERDASGESGWAMFTPPSQSGCFHAPSSPCDSPSTSLQYPGTVLSTLKGLTYVNLTAALGGEHCQHSHFTDGENRHRSILTCLRPSPQPSTPASKQHLTPMHRSPFPDGRGLPAVLS